MEVPTLLVGLGGIGSHIVDEVYGMLPESKRGRVAVMAFDTNINDIRKLKHINRSNIIQTSANYTVRQYINKADSTVKEWFPFESGEVMNKRLTEGAGQIRAVSRLAYRAAIESDKMVKLQSNLRRIFRNDDSGFTASPRIMIVSTLAGGTGAGLFQQVALYLKDVLADTFRVENVLVRGALLLPDVLVATGAIKTGRQIDNIRTNAYACIKELNAITKNAMGVDQQMAIELEYRPDLQDIDGRVNHYLTSNHLPYDFCFLYDDLNMNGRSLEYLGNYINQVIKTIYLDLFSPIADGTFSKQDNEIINLIENNGLNRYCGSGAASIEYPYEDMLNYFSLRWFTDSLGADWLRIDELYEEDMREYKRTIAQQGIAEKPHRGERFLYHLKFMGTGESPKPFFRNAYRDCHLISKDGEIGAPKALEFVQAIGDEIDRMVREDEKLNIQKENLYLDRDKLKVKEHALGVIQQMEDELALYKRQVLQFINTSKNYMTNQILIADEDSPKGHQDISYHLNTWILNRIESVHPVAARAILYQTEIALEKKADELRTTNEALLSAIRNYDIVYDLEETQDLIETAEDRIRTALDQSMMGRMFKSRFKSFIKEYADASSEQAYNLDTYVKSKLKEEVYNGVRKGIRILMQDFERFFNNLSDVSDKLRAECNLLANKHEKSGDVTRVFVLATQKMKEQMWERVGMGAVSHELPNEISEQIYLGQYKRFCTQQRGEYVTEERPEKVEEMIRRDVISWGVGELRKEDRINFNIIRAIRKEAEMLNMDSGKIDDYIKERIQRLDNLTSPLIPEPMEGGNISKFDAWGIHPDSVKELAGQTVNELFAGEKVENDAFSEYEIMRTKTVFGLKINDFQKFHCGDEAAGQTPGVYFSSYVKRIKKLEDGRSITPHLDKRWHSPYYLPDLHEASVSRLNTKIVKALTYGLSLGILKAIPYDNRHYWEFQGEENNKWVQYNQEKATADFYTLFRALNQSMGIVDAVLARAEKIFEADKRKHKQEVSKYQFLTRCTKIDYPAHNDQISILDMFIEFFSHHTVEETDEDTGYTLLRDFVSEIYDFYLSVYGSGRKNTAKDEVNKLFKNRLLRYSKVLDSMDAKERIKTVIENKIKGLG